MVNQSSKNTNSEKNITLDQIQIIPNYQGITDLPIRKKKKKKKANLILLILHQLPNLLVIKTMLKQKVPRAKLLH